MPTRSRFNVITVREIKYENTFTVRFYASCHIDLQAGKVSAADVPSKEQGPQGGAALTVSSYSDEWIEVTSRTLLLLFVRSFMLYHRLLNEFGGVGRTRDTRRVSDAAGIKQKPC
jgi:hypothetical protein